MIQKSLFLLFFFSLSVTQSGKIIWRENHQLSWSDFKGKADKNNPFVAAADTGINLKYSYEIKRDSVKFEFSVESFFNPKTSWYKKDKINSHVLKHEQAHFDITEIHTRKLRKILEETVFTKNVKNEVERIYTQIEKEQKIAQNKFDKETNHSQDHEKELLWREYISKELKKYDNWK